MHESEEHAQFKVFQWADCSKRILVQENRRSSLRSGMGHRPLWDVFKWKCNLGYCLTALWFCIFGTPIGSVVYPGKLAPNYKALAFWHISAYVILESLIMDPAFPEFQCRYTGAITTAQLMTWQPSLKEMLRAGNLEEVPSRAGTVWNWTVHRHQDQLLEEEECKLFTQHHL